MVSGRRFRRYGTTDVLYYCFYTTLITSNVTDSHKRSTNPDDFIPFSTFERVEEFKYLGTTLTNQNSIEEEIKSKLRSGNACYNSVHNLLSSRLLSKNLKIKIYKTIILPIVLYGCET